jgi:hypothetical protein
MCRLRGACRGAMLQRGGMKRWRASRNYQWNCGLSSWDSAPEWSIFWDWLMEHQTQYTEVICSAWEPNGHEQHNKVSQMVKDVMVGMPHREYLTYTRTFGKSRRNPYEVVPQNGLEIERKLRALAAYSSQMQMDPRLGTAEWFYGNDLREYLL